MNLQQYTKKEIKTAKKHAYNFFTSFRYLYQYKDDFKFDGRTRIGNLSYEYFLELKKSINRKDIKEKIEKRKNNKFIFKNIFSNPLVNDFIKNKINLDTIYKDRLRFSGRNHWAKNDYDKKILLILQKHNNKF